MPKVAHLVKSPSDMSMYPTPNAALAHPFYSTPSIRKTSNKSLADYLFHVQRTVDTRAEH